MAHTVGNGRVRLRYARLLAELIADATVMQLDGDDHASWFADNWRKIVDARMRFITGTEIAVSFV